MSLPSHPRAFALAVAVAAALLAPSARAAWQPDGTPLSPQPVGLQHWSMEGLVSDGADGAFVVWRFGEPLPDFSGTNYAIAAQRVDVLGNRPPAWPAAGVNLFAWLDSNPSGIQYVEMLPLLPDGPGAIAPLISHQFVVEYVNRFQLYHISAGGAVVGVPGFSGIFAGYAVVDAAADADGAGGVVMMGWAQTFAPPPGSPPPGPLFTQRIDASGVPLWPAPLSSPGPELTPGANRASGGIAALGDGAGGGFFAWMDGREPGDPDLYLQHLDMNGAVAPGWPADGVQVCGATGGQFEPHLASDGLGGVFVVWRDERDGTSRLYGQRVLASGAPAAGIPADGRMLPSSDLDDRFVNLAADGLNGCFVVRAGVNPSQVGISHLYRLDPVLQPRPGWPTEGLALNTLSPAAGAVGLLPDLTGGAFVSWRNGFGNTAPQGLYAQHFAPDATPAPGWTAAGYRLSGNGQDSRIVRSGWGAIVGWNDYRTAWVGVYAQRLADDGPVAIEIAIVRAHAEPGRVALRWYAAEGAGLRATVERRGEASGWTPLAEVAGDGTGYLDYEDRAVEPGARYAYRLAWLEGEATRTSGEAWVTVPADLALALEAPRPNPARGAVSVAVVLPEAGAARLDVLDLAGRRVLTRDLAGLGAGRHLVALGEAAALAPGIYTLRLAQRGVARHTRMCVMR